jgi:ABC-type Na+ efflux pump permease subunit
MSPVAKALALVPGAVALVGVIALAVITVAAVIGSGPLALFAMPILVVGVLIIIAALLAFAVIVQGINDLQSEPDDPPS